MPIGHVISLRTEKGFGFIRPKGEGSDVFFHNSAVNCPIEILRVGQEVHFELDHAAEKPRAKAVMAAAGSRKPRAVSQDRTRRASSTRSRPSRPAPKSERGFITKILWTRSQGFISADCGGVELQFNASDVAGEKRYQQLKVGDYVEFVRCHPAPDPAAGETPMAKLVRAIERVPKRQPSLQLPQNPKARRKKPAWR